MEKELYAEMADLETHHWWFLGRRAIILDVLARFAGPSRGTLLDVGVGTGENAAAFVAEGFSVEGIESSLDAIAYAKKKVPTLAIQHHSFPAADQKEGMYDVVTLLDVIEHLEDDRGALKSAAQALKKNGLVLMTTPAFSFLWTSHDELAHHKRRYRKKEIQALMRTAGIEPLFVSYFNFFLFPAIVLVRIITKLFGGKRVESDFSRTPGVLNKPLAMLFGAERFLLRLTELPFGVSLIAVGRKVL